VQGEIGLDKLGPAGDERPLGGEEHCLAPHLIGAASPMAAP
jgi:hypothetical protein